MQVSGHSIRGCGYLASQVASSWSPPGAPREGLQLRSLRCSEQAVPRCHVKDFLHTTGVRPSVLTTAPAPCWQSAGWRVSELLDSAGLHSACIRGYYSAFRGDLSLAAIWVTQTSTLHTGCKNRATRIYARLRCLIELISEHCKGFGNECVSFITCID